MQTEVCLLNLIRILFVHVSPNPIIVTGFHFTYAFPRRPWEQEHTDKSHGGTLTEERDIPLYVIGDRFSHQAGCAPKQTEICGIICELLGLLDHRKSVTKNLLLNEAKERSEHKIIMAA